MTVDVALPNAESLLALEHEELAGVVIEHFNSLPNNERWALQPHNFVNLTSSPVNRYPNERQEDVARAFMEAWEWLVREGLVAGKPGSPGWYFITRRGSRMKSAFDLDAYRKSNLLPKKLLHPVIAVKVWATFLRGDYDTAVFQAFKEVEVAVRIAGGFDAESYGVQLMRDAFDPERGPLTDKSLPSSERRYSLVDL